MATLTAILNFLLGLIGIIPKAATPEAVAEKTGEDAGRAKATAANVTDSLHEVERAQTGSTNATVAISAHPDVLRRVDNPAASGPNPGRYD